VIIAIRYFSLVIFSTKFDHELPWFVSYLPLANFLFGSFELFIDFQYNNRYL